MGLQSNMKRLTLLLVTGLVLCAWNNAQSQVGSVARISLGLAGAEPNGDSHSALRNAATYGQRISADGRYVTYASSASNLVPGDTNGVADVFVFDRQLLLTARVSVATGGAQANGSSDEPAISDDGRVVVFTSTASNLASGDTNGLMDVYARDLVTGITTRISTSTNGTQGNSDSYLACVSGNGQYVAFQSWASNLVSSDTNGTADVLLKDRTSGTTTVVSVSSAGTRANNWCSPPSMSADGRYVTFFSWATNLVSGDTNATLDGFLRDRQTGTTSRISLTSTGGQANGECWWPSVSDDGRYVFFDALATNLVPGDTNGSWDVFVRDRQTSTTRRISVSSAGAEAAGYSVLPSASADGRYVAFRSSAANLVPQDWNGSDDIFVHDIFTSITTRHSMTFDGFQANANCEMATMSPDGRFIAYESTASNLVSVDANSFRDVFVRQIRETLPANDTIDIDFSQNSLPRASLSGILLGMDPVSPQDGVISPLRPSMWRGGSWILQRALGFGSRYSLLMSEDYGYPNSNYGGRGAPWLNWTAYESFVRDLARQHIGQPVYWEPWNEPDISEFWTGTMAQYYELYARTYRVLRQELGPNVMVGGPSLAFSKRESIRSFLDYCVSQSVEVNFLACHDLDIDDDIPSLKTRLVDRRASFLDNIAYSSLDLREIHSNEFIGPSAKYQPAENLAYLAQGELGGADAACKGAWWDDIGESTAHNRTLAGLVTRQTYQPRSGWWLFKTYSDGVNGRTTSTSTNPAITSLASRISDTPQTGQVLIGYYNRFNSNFGSRSVRVNANQLSAISGGFGGICKVDTYLIDNLGEAPVLSLSTMSTQILPVAQDSVSFEVPNIGLHQVVLAKLRPATVPVSGTVMLGDYQGDVSSQSIDIQIRQGSQVIEELVDVPLSSGGQFAASVSYMGTFVVAIKSSHWLRKATSPMSIGQNGTSGVALSLINGDIDADNENSIGDFAILSQSYGSSIGDPSWTASADLNGDETIDIADFAVLSANYGLSGD